MKFAIAALYLVSLTACGPRLVRAPQAAVPAAVQLQLFDQSQIWVAGFVASAAVDRIDVNQETVSFVRDALRGAGASSVVEREPLSFDSDDVFTDAGYWQRLAEEHGAPFVVTGDVRLSLAPPVMVQRGRRTIFFSRAGRVLDATVLVIDGHTGRVRARQQLPRRMKYEERDVALGLALYFKMMEQNRAEWVTTIARGVQ